MNDRLQRLGEVWTAAMGAPAPLEGVSLPGAEPVLPSSFRAAAAAQISIAAVALAAREIDRKRNGGRNQQVGVDLTHAALECRSERFVSVDGKAPAELMDELAGAYPCAGGFVRLHTNFDHHRQGILSLLRAAPDRAAITEALRAWRAEDFETAATESGMPVAAMRSFEAWDAHPHAAFIAAAPLVRITRVGDAPPPAMSASARPLQGLRVLESTRIIAAPVTGRALAAHGADVLRIIAAGLPTIAIADIDTGRGKRSAHLDIATPDGGSRFATLAAEADVVLQSYRPGVFERHGFGVGELVALKPGLIVASLSAYGTLGPWAGKRGFDSLVQTAVGFNQAEAEAVGEAKPRVLPMQILDHASGYLLAFGIIAARLRQMREGGAYHVEVTLARTAHWLRGLGRLPDGPRAPDLGATDAAAYLETVSAPQGAITAIRHSGMLSATPPRYALPSAPYGTHQPIWE